MLIQRKRMDLGIPSDSSVQDIFIKAMRFRLSSLSGAEIILDTKRKERDPSASVPADAMYHALRSFFRLDDASRNSVHVQDAILNRIDWVVVSRDPRDARALERWQFHTTGRGANLDFDGVHGEVRACLERNGIVATNDAKGTASEAIALP